MERGLDMTTVNPTDLRLRKGFGAGVGAALAMIVVMALMRFALGVPTIPELLQGAFLRLVPGDLFEFMIHLLQAGAKVLLLVSVLEGMLLAGGGLGWLFTRLWRPTPAGAAGWRRLTADRYRVGALYGLVIGLGLVAIFLLLYLFEVMNPQPSSSILLPVSVALLIYGVVFGSALVSLLPWPEPAGARVAVAAAGDAADSERRGFLRIAGGTALALVAGAGLWGVLAKALAEPESADLVGGADATPLPTSTTDPAVAADLRTAVVESGGDVAALDGDAVGGTAVPANTAAPQAPTAPAATGTAPAATDTAGPAATDTAVPATAAAQAAPTQTPFPAVPVLSPELTPVENFYITTKNFTDPNLDVNQWSLTIKGLVANPMTLSMADIKALPQVKVVHTLECISNTVGGDLIGNQRWTGVRVADLMKKVRPQSGVVDMIFRAADDYTDSVPISVLMNPDTVLAYEMNGKPLVPKHGYPARLLIPGIFGMKNVKWITQMEAVNYDYKGFWQSQGWSDPAPYLTMSRIDYPTGGAVKQKPLYVGGIAFAGNRGIGRVEVSVDGGKTWGDAQVRRPLGRNTWVLWTYPWIPTAPGDTTLVVRATDGTGAVQTADDANNYPDGATGYHKVAVKVVRA
jgi:DMSO/TMAO reductase YedYZ molybdopterin-dependent catalytic subunit